jgi:hypothetical protein
MHLLLRAKRLFALLHKQVPVLQHGVTAHWQQQQRQ